MLKAVKRLWNYILTNKYPIGDFIWQMDADLDALNAMIIEATNYKRSYLRSVFS